MAGAEGGGKRRDRENHYHCAAILHPLRHRILRLMFNGPEAGVSEIADALDQPLGRVAYHVFVLVRHNALKTVPRRRPAAPLYRWSPDAEWARKMLGEIDEQGWEDD
jgi:DNA-binding transcriptional ArsR family regulator